MRLGFSFLFIIVFISSSSVFAQTDSEIVKDSVIYGGKAYSYTWWDGFQCGKRDGEYNNTYVIQFFDGVPYRVEHDTRTQVSNDWAEGYKSGFLTGEVFYNAKLSNSDSIELKKGRYVSRTWYNNNMDFETVMMPGLAYNLLIPKAQDSLGNFQGVGVEYLFYGAVVQNDHPGPSHGRFYGRLNLLKSSRKTVINDAFSYTLGVDFSIEKNPKRNFLIPFFGLEVGGITQKQLGTTLQFTPTAGVHILANRNLFIGVQGGYMYPIRNFDYLRGYTAQASINFALW